MTSKGVKTKHRIVKAASDLMLTRGISGTSVDDILEKSRAGKSQFYYYFKNKDALVKEVLGFRARTGWGTLIESLRKVKSLPDLQRVFRETVTQVEKKGCVGGCTVGSLANELADTNRQLSKQAMEYMGQLKEEFRKTFVRLKEKGVLSKIMDAESLADFLLSSLQGALLLTKAGKNAKPLQTALDQFFSYLKSFR